MCILPRNFVLHLFLLLNISIGLAATKNPPKIDGLAPLVRVSRLVVYRQTVTFMTMASSDPILTYGHLSFESNAFYGTVSIIDREHNNAVTTVNVGSFPRPPVLYGHLLVVANRYSGTISIIDLEHNNEVTTVNVGIEPSPPVLHGHLLVVTHDESGIVSIIDLEHNNAVTTVNVGGRPSPPVLYGHMVLVSDTWSNTVSIIDLEHNNAVTTVNVVRMPRTPVLCGHLALLSIWTSNTVYIIDLEDRFSVIRVDMEENVFRIHTDGNRIVLTTNTGRQILWEALPTNPFLRHQNRTQEQSVEAGFASFRDMGIRFRS